MRAVIASRISESWARSTSAGGIPPNLGIRLGIEDIAHAAHRADHRGVARLALDLAPDTGDADVDRTVEVFLPMRVREIEQRFPAQGSAWAFGKGAQQLELRGDQRHLPPV